ADGVPKPIGQREEQDHQDQVRSASYPALIVGVLRTREERRHVAPLGCSSDWLYRRWAACADRVRGRFVGQQSSEPPLGPPPREGCRPPGRYSGFPGGQNVSSLIFTSLAWIRPRRNAFRR